jgi:mono/diheme cytochrome c family protein
MKLVLRLALPLMALLVTACGTVATPVWSEQAQETQVALVATSDHLTAIAPTATYTPIPAATATPFPTATPLPISPTPAPTEPPTATPIPPTAEPVAAVTGNAENGKVLFETFRAEVSFACATCHHVDSDDRLIGPGLLNIVDHVEQHGTGETPAEYIRHSIVEPGAFVVPDYPDNLMPRTYAELFTEEEINDLVAYVLSLGS